MWDARIAIHSVPVFTIRQGACQSGCLLLDKGFADSLGGCIAHDLARSLPVGLTNSRAKCPLKGWLESLPKSLTNGLAGSLRDPARPRPRLLCVCVRVCALEDVGRERGRCPTDVDFYTVSVRCALSRAVCLHVDDIRAKHRH